MFHVVHLSTGRVLKSYNARGWAIRHIDWLVERDAVRGSGYFTRGNLEVMTAEDYERRKDDIDPLIEVINMMSGKPVKIRMSDAGTCVDPSTETYWSM